jgi:hypothetical protein
MPWSPSVLGSSRQETPTPPKSLRVERFPIHTVLHIRGLKKLQKNRFAGQRLISVVRKTGLILPIPSLGVYAKPCVALADGRSAGSFYHSNNTRLASPWN